MMSERAYRILRCRSPMRVSRRPNGRIARRREVERQKALLSKLQVIKRSQFHNEVMRKLPIGDRNSESCLTLLKEQGIPPVGHGRRFQAQHRACGKYAWAELSLRHRHEPARRKKLVSAPLTGLLLIENEHVRVEHESRWARRSYPNRCGSKWIVQNFPASSSGRCRRVACPEFLSPDIPAFS